MDRKTPILFSSLPPSTSLPLPTSLLLPPSRPPFLSPFSPSLPPSPPSSSLPPALPSSLPSLRPSLPPSFLPLSPSLPLPSLPLPSLPPSLSLSHPHLSLTVPQKSAGEAPPTFWHQVVDTNSNHPYYWNPLTNEVSWVLPDGGVCCIIHVCTVLVPSTTV